MKFLVAADTDAGLIKLTNQDSILIKHAAYDGGHVLMAVVCDGMGGLSHGEVASATVIKAFGRWFTDELPVELEAPDLEIIAHNWSLMLKKLNTDLAEYGEMAKSSLGTTFTGMLFINDKYVIVHVGDTRAYHINSYEARKLTTDQTFVAREIARGTMTPEQARVDKRRNVLLQCIGASKVVEPEIILGTAEKGMYMLCSDGFRHKITAEEIRNAFDPQKNTSKEIMQRNARMLIDTVKDRQERDNISVIIIKAE